MTGQICDFRQRDRTLRHHLGRARHHRRAIADGNEEKTRKRILQRNGEVTEASPPVEVQQAIEGMKELLAGKPNDCSTSSSISTACRNSIAASTTSRENSAGQDHDLWRYRQEIGGVELSRDVGQALGRNPCPIVVPCHRVLAAGNKPGGFSANGGVVTKLKMLAIEGAAVNHTPSLFE